MPIPYWAGHYIGLPFKERGRTSDGLDCWGLVRMVLNEQFDIQVPSYAYEYRSTQSARDIAPLIHRARQSWQPVKRDDMQCGDVMILRMQNVPMHAAMVLDRQYILHIERGINSVIERSDSRRWKDRLIGIYRHKDL